MTLSTVPLRCALPAARSRPAAVPGAASTAVRSIIAGPVVRARVLAAFPAAIYLEVLGDVVAVTAADSARMPLAVVLASPAATAGLADRAERGGTAAWVGAGDMLIGDLTVRVARWWDPPRLSVPVTGALGAAVRGLDAGLAERPLAVPVAVASERLHNALTGGAYLSIARAVSGLVGLGPGLTPAGDDILSGALVTLRALGARDAAELLGCATTRHLAATTALSAALLRHAVAGLSCPELAAVVVALASPSKLSEVLAGLLGIGASSGADLAHGVLLAARLVSASG